MPLALCPLQLENSKKETRTEEPQEGLSVFAYVEPEVIWELDLEHPGTNLCLAMKLPGWP